MFQRFKQLKRFNMFQVVNRVFTNLSIVYVLFYINQFAVIEHKDFLTENPEFRINPFFPWFPIIRFKDFLKIRIAPCIAHLLTRHSRGYLAFSDMLLNVCRKTLDLGFGIAHLVNAACLQKKNKCERKNYGNS